MSSRGARRAATIALLALAGGVTPSKARAQDLQCDAGELEVRSLEFEGNRSISDDELSRVVRTTPSAFFRRALRLPFGARRCLAPDQLPRDSLLLTTYYRERGFNAVVVTDSVQPLDARTARVIFSITEGPPTILKSYDVVGLEGLPDSANLMNRRRLHVGEPFDLALYRADLDSMVQRLRNAGYYRAMTLQDYQTWTDSLIARVTLRVVPGKPARFGGDSIHVTPVDERGQQISDDVVRRVMGIAPGQTYSDRAIVDAQRALFQLGAYQHVEIAPLPDSLQPPGDTIVVLDVRLTEDYMHRLDQEYAWATLDCFRVRMQYTDLNLVGTARRFELTGQASKIGFGEPLATPGTKDVCRTLDANQALASDTFSTKLHYYGGFSIRQPRLLGTRWVPTLSVYSERRGEFKAYLRETSLGGDFSATRDIAARTQLRVGYSLEHGRTDAPDAVLCAIFSRCDDQTRSRIKDFADLGVIGAAVVRRRTDNVFNPNRGSLMRAEFRSSALPVGTSKDLFFSKGLGDVYVYAPLGGNVLALRLRGGAVVGRRLADTLNFVPPQERLYAGGATSIRGFQQNELGDVVYIARTTNIDTTIIPGVGADTTFRYSVAGTAPYDRVVPIGGSNLFVANLEYRIRDPFFFPDYVQYTMFVDAGDVWNRPRQPRLKVTPGLGIRVVTPVGPVQVNVGYNRYDRPAGPIYYEDPSNLANSTLSPLYCVSPGNTVDLKRVNGVLLPQQSGCPATYAPRQSQSFLQRLAFTFSLGPDF